MMDESQFHRLADQVLTAIFERLEEEDREGILSVDLENGSLVIESEDGRQIVVTKHAPTQQIWVASPISGGLHLYYNDAGWALKDGTGLTALVSHELKALTSKDFLTA